MAEALATSSSNNNNNNRSREMENLSLEISQYPRDLFQKLFPPNQSRTIGREKLGHVDEDDDGGGLNLGLGLSLGGKFGVDKSHKLGLMRSSSVVGTMPLIGEIDRVAPPPPPPTPVHTLSRTASLPVETEEEWRKRKMMQTLRRMEAKRRRSEKQRVLKVGGGGGEEKGVESLNFRGRLKREQQCLGVNNTNKIVSSSSNVGKPFGSSTPPKVEYKGRRTTFGSLQGFLNAQSQSQAQGSQGSGESQGETHQGSSSCGEARSPGSSPSQQDRVSQDSGTKGGESTHHLGFGLDSESSSLKQPENHGDHSKKQEGGMEDMPRVFTIGNGPKGIRKVEGILYRFGKGEEVRIMCVCHGSFFSPADFVKHAGGEDVDHPLRHIVVSPSASPFP